MPMHDEALQELAYISQAVGVPVDYTQGGGGNTSVKLDAELMAVKASGFKLKQISRTEGFVVVNYRNIRAYYEAVDQRLEKDYEQESAEMVKSNIVAKEGEKKLRPSVEAGFHSLLKRYVIHTHSVYANILCCAQNGRELVEKIFSGREYAVVWIPYTNPGFCLTLRIKEAIAAALKNGGRFPAVIFMENHGLIVTTDDSRECVELHREVNEVIKRYFGIQTAFPEIALSAVDAQTIRSRTAYIAEYLRRKKITARYFEEIILYPDQLVYLNGNLAANGAHQKLYIDPAAGEITYKTNHAEAQTIEETLMAYLYVIDEIERNGLPLKTMSAHEVDFIKNWESEAYRRALVKNLGK